MMETFLLIMIILIVAYLLYRDFLYRLEFSFERTFWMEKIRGIRITWWNKYHICGTGRTLIMFKYDLDKDRVEYLGDKK